MRAFLKNRAEGLTYQNAMKATEMEVLTYGQKGRPIS